MDDLLAILARYQIYAVIAFVVTVFATPLAVRAAMQFGIMDMPDKALKPHARPTPYLGGIAILLGWGVALVLAKVWGTIPGTYSMPILAGGVAMAIIGLVDDIRHIHGRIRLALTAAVTLAVLFSSGLGLTLVELTLLRAGISVPHYVAVPVSVVVCLLIVLGACNSANLIDGLDGLLTGVTAIMAMGFMLLAAFLAGHLHSPRAGDPARLTLSMALLGAVLGFLPWNFNPARIFMGDAGSILLGYNCGMMILLFAERGYPRWVIGALMVFSLPIFDTALTLVRRYRKRQSIFEGDRSHFYDQLVQRGLTVRQAVLVCYLLSALFAASGVLLVIYVRTMYSAIIYLCVCLLVVLLAWKFNLIDPREFEIERREREARRLQRAGPDARADRPEAAAEPEGEPPP